MGGGDRVECPGWVVFSPLRRCNTLRRMQQKASVHGRSNPYDPAGACWSLEIGGETIKDYEDDWQGIELDRMTGNSLRRVEWELNLKGRFAVLPEEHRLCVLS